MQCGHGRKRAVRAKEDRVSVRRGVRDDSARDRPIAAAAIIDEHLLTHGLRELLRDHPTHIIRKATRRKGHDKTDRADRILRLSRRSREHADTNSRDDACDSKHIDLLPVCDLILPQSDAAHAGERYPMLFLRPRWLAVALCWAESLAARAHGKLQRVAHSLVTARRCKPPKVTAA